MLGIWGSHASQFLSVVGWLTLVLFSIPITFCPLRWAKVVGWEIPQQTHLALYFGRCLGCLAIGISIMSLVAAEHALVQPFYFEFLLIAFVSMVILHIYGAVKKIQPILETYEIGFWSGLVLLTLAFWPALN